MLRAGDFCKPLRDSSIVNGQMRYAECTGAGSGRSTSGPRQWRMKPDTMMAKKIDRGERAAQAEGAVGIVVQTGWPQDARPRAVAFVWGGEVRPAPSLPFGRWKTAVRSAA